MKCRMNVVCACIKCWVDVEHRERKRERDREWGEGERFT